MSEIKKGDKVMVSAEVIGTPDSQGDILVSFGHGFRSYVPFASITVSVGPDELKVGDKVGHTNPSCGDLSGAIKAIEPSHTDPYLVEWSNGLARLPEPTLKVGDRVRTNGGHDTTIEELKIGYQLKDGNIKFCGLFTHDTLTKLPPEPSHRVEYGDDRLNLIRLVSPLTGGACQCDHVDMANPAEVERHIVKWARNNSIDADEVRKMIAEPTLIATRVIGRAANYGAMRYADGWRVFIATSCDDGAVFTDGILQPEHLARVLFPEINGPYLDQELEEL